MFQSYQPQGFLQFIPDGAREILKNFYSINKSRFPSTLPTVKNNHNRYQISIMDEYILYRVNEYQPENYKVCQTSR